MGWSGRRSVSNFSFNHMGNFAGANEATAKSLFFGGVFHRFPGLRCGFLEGGVTWGVQMLVGLIEHFEKRAPEGLKERDPAGIDGAEFDRLVAEYGRDFPEVPNFGESFKTALSTPEVSNDFAAAGIEDPKQIIEQFHRQCFFGCEADDSLAGVAFDTNRMPGGRPVNPMFSSDIGHWDVAHMDEVLPEAFEHLEHGWMNKDGFRAFMADNAIRMWTDMNPDFFAGTVVEDYVAKSETD